MMKFLPLLLAGLFTLASAFGDQIGKAAYLEIPLPDNRVDSYLNGRALVVESNNVLKECVKKLGLAQRWKVSEAEATKSLAEKVSALRKPGTDFLRIEARGSSAKEADELLAHVIDTSVEHFTRIEKSRKKRSLEALDRQIHEQGDRLQEFRKAVVVLTQQYGIPYFEGERNQIGKTEVALYQQSQKKLAELEHQRNLAQIQIRQLIDTPNEDLIRLAAGLELPKNHVSKYYQSSLTLKTEIDALREVGLAPGHPEVKALQQKIDQALSTAGKQVLGLKEILETNLHLMDKKVERTKLEVKSRKDACLEHSLHLFHYNKAIREYEAAQGLYEKTSRQLHELRIEAEMPLTYQVHKIP